MKERGLGWSRQDTQIHVALGYSGATMSIIKFNDPFVTDSQGRIHAKMNVALREKAQRTHKPPPLLFPMFGFIRQMARPGPGNKATSADSIIHPSAAIMPSLFASLAMQSLPILGWFFFLAVTSLIRSPLCCAVSRADGVHGVPANESVSP